MVGVEEVGLGIEVSVSRRRRLLPADVQGALL